MSNVFVWVSTKDSTVDVLLKSQSSPVSFTRVPKFTRLASVSSNKSMLHETYCGIVGHQSNQSYKIWFCALVIPTWTPPKPEINVSTSGGAGIVDGPRLNRHVHTINYLTREAQPAIKYNFSISDWAWQHPEADSGFPEADC